MYAVADDDANCGRRWLEGYHPKDILASLHIEFFDESVRVSSQPPLNFDFQALQVLERTV